MPPSTSLIDVNVIARAGALPTSKMTGSELELAVASATKSLGRVAIYSLGTMSDQDISEIPGAMGASATVTDKTLDGTWTVKVTAPSSSDNRLTVDGIQWPAAGDSALVPAGFHRLIWSQGSAAGPGLVSFTDELGTASVSKSLLLFSYYSHSDALAVLTARPTELLLDGTPATLSVLPDPAGGFVIRMPAGTHQAVIEF
jgi:hypothetical protein